MGARPVRPASQETVKPVRVIAETVMAVGGANSLTRMT